MRGFLFCLIVLAGAGFAAYHYGWISFEKTDDGKTQISIDNQKVREDTNKAIDKSREFLDDAKDKLNKNQADDQTDQADQLDATSGGN